MTDSNHERWSEDLAAYLLGALDPEETAELERHALGCERCRSQLGWLTPAVQALPDSVERLEPPRELRSRILAEVRSDAAGADGASTSTVAAVGHPPGITAEVVREGDQGTLRLANVTKLPDDHVLEAWVRREGEVEPVRELFVPDRNGNASATIGDMRHVDLVMVTTEPAGGSEAPTSSPIVKVPIPAQ
jgi:anti-sigma-K factor RskA